MFYVCMLWTFYVSFTYPYHGYVTKRRRRRKGVRGNEEEKVKERNEEKEKKNEGSKCEIGKKGRSRRGIKIIVHRQTNEEKESEEMSTE